MSKKTVLITGASAGIGRETALVFAALGYQLILLARREERLQALAKELAELEGAVSHIVVCDVTDQQALSHALQTLPKEFASIDVLINNAGLALGLETADKTDWLDWQTMINTNVTALAFITRQILPDMVARNTGLIVNLGSIAGNYAYRGGNAYGATKAFVDQFSLNLRADLLGTNIRVTNLVPGLIGETEFSNVRFHGDDQAAANVYDNCQALRPQDIAETIRWVATLPAHVNINRVEIMPTCQAPAGLAVHKG